MGDCGGAGCGVCTAGHMVARVPDNVMEAPFAIKVGEVLEQIERMLIEKNRKYGNSALEPIGVFSKLSPKEGLLIRIDDKLKRIKNGSLDKDDEDVVNDLIGYLVLLKIHAKELPTINLKTDPFFNQGIT
jgi:hypothetical protein